MKSADRKNLEKLAWERMLATATDDEQWSFAFRTPGSVDFLYCPWSATEDWEFDCETEGLTLPWAPKRLDRIKDGKAEPNEKELRQWRRAKCQKLAAGSDWSWIAWIVPLWIDRKKAGYVLFLAPLNGDPDDPPQLNGVYATLDEARKALTVEGAVHFEK